MEEDSPVSSIMMLPIHMQEATLPSPQAQQAMAAREEPEATAELPAEAVLARMAMEEMEVLEEPEATPMQEDFLEPIMVAATALPTFTQLASLQEQKQAEAPEARGEPRAQAAVEDQPEAPEPREPPPFSMSEA